MTTVTYTVNREEYFTVYVKRVVMGILLKLYAILFVVVFLATLVSVVDWGQYNDWVILIPAVTIVAAEFALPVMLVCLVTVACLMWFRLGPESPMLDSEIKFSFSEDDLKMETEETNLEFKWRFVRTAKIYKDYYFLMVKQPMGQMLFIPKRTFREEQEEEFEKLIEGRF